MNEMLNFFKKSITSPPQDNKQKQNPTKQIENYDQSLLQSIQSSSNQSNKNSQKSPNQRNKSQQAIQNQSQNQKQQNIDKNRKNSDDFQQMKEQNSKVYISQEKLPESQLQPQLSQEQSKHEEQIINIRQTLDFNDDLTQSIRQDSLGRTSNSSKKSFWENDQQHNQTTHTGPSPPSNMSKKEKTYKQVQINQNSQNYQENQQNLRGTFSDLNNSNLKQKQDIRGSFSDLNNNNQQQQDIRGSFSDLNHENQSQRDNRLSFSNMNEYEDVENKKKFSKVKDNKGKNGQNKNSNTNKKNSDLIDLWGNDQEVSQSKYIRQQGKNIKKNDDINNNNKYDNKNVNVHVSWSEADDDAQIQLGKSMYTQKAAPIQKKTFNKNKNHQSPHNANKIAQKQSGSLRNSPINIQMRNSADFNQQDIQKEYQRQMRKLNQSHYMKAISNQRPNKKVSSSKEQKQNEGGNVIRQNKKLGIHFTIDQKDGLYFINFNNTSRHINQKLLQNITQHFLILNIMLPMFDVKKFQLCKNQSKLETKKQLENSFMFYINVYFEFICKKYPEQMNRFFVNQKQPIKSSTLESTNQLKKQQQQGSTFGAIYKKFAEYFQKNHYSKAEILKKYLQSQLQLLNQISRNWIAQAQQSKQNFSFSKATKNLSKPSSQILSSKNQPPLQKKPSTKTLSIQTKIKQIIKQITQLQILISFQKSQIYCQNKLEQKLEEGIWKQKKKKLIDDRNWYITEMFNLSLI